MLVRMALSGLLRRYPWFASFLAYDMVTSFVVYHLHVSSNQVYSEIWAILQVPFWVLQIGTVYEMYWHLVESYPGIGRLADFLLVNITGIGIATATIITLATPTSFPFGVAFAMQASKALALICAILMIAPAVVFALIPIPMKPNVVWHRRLQTIWWVTNGIALLLVGHGVTFAAWRDIGLLGTELLCCLAWVTVWHRAGELEPYLGEPPSLEESAEIEEAYDSAFRTLPTLYDLIKEAYESSMRTKHR